MRGVGGGNYRGGLKEGMSGVAGVAIIGVAIIGVAIIGVAAMGWQS